MDKRIRNRLITIGVLIAASVASLVPRNTRQRVVDQTTGRMKDTTIRRLPINLGLDLQGGIHLALEVDQSKGPIPDCADAKARGAAAPSAVAQLFGGDTSKAARDSAADANAPGVLSSLLFQGQLPGEYLVPEEQWPLVDSLIQRPDVRAAMPRGIELRWGAQTESRGARAYRALYAVESKPIITGEELVKAVARRDPVTNQSIGPFQLSHRGARRFSDETARHINDYMAIILDGRVQGQPPVIRGQIGANGQIELGNKSLQEASDLALVLRAGALPAPLSIIEERTIGPSLGADSIKDGVTAGVVGVVLVVVIMVGYYRMSGALAVAALTLYCLFTLAGLAGFGFTLTLPRLAGFVLCIFISVGANVLIFERIR